MSNVVNLNQYRKKRRRQNAQRKASINRVKFGRLKAEREISCLDEAKRAQELNLKKRENRPDSPRNSGEQPDSA